MNKLTLAGVTLAVSSLTGCQAGAGASAARDACGEMSWLTSPDAVLAEPDTTKSYADDVVSKLLEAARANDRYAELAQAGLTAMQRVARDDFTPQIFDNASYTVLTELADTRCHALGVGKG